MSSENQPIATSTPIPEAAKSPSVLQEKQLNKESRSRPSQKKINFSPRSLKSTKENVSHPKNGSSGVTSRRRSEGDVKKEAYRRQQALEAMQILEQRRQRMSQQNLDEEFQEMSLKLPVEESRDALMEKKRLEAKRVKEKRVRAHIAEQEAAKKKEAEVAGRQNQPPRANIPRPLHPNSRQKNRVTLNPKPFDLPQLSEEEEEEPKLQQILHYRPPFMPPPTQKLIIRYSKDDLRALNPYGYYFMWSATFISFVHCMSIDTSYCF